MIVFHLFTSALAKQSCIVSSKMSSTGMEYHIPAELITRLTSRNKKFSVLFIIINCKNCALACLGENCLALFVTHFTLILSVVMRRSLRGRTREKTPYR